MVTVEQLVSIAARNQEILERVGNGSIDPTAVKRALQDLFERMTWNPPTWWSTTEQQLERARQLWPNAVLPEPPKGFTPRTKSEVLLLHVPDSFDSLWDKVVAPRGYAKRRGDYKELRLAPGKVEYTQPLWVYFDPEHGRGEEPKRMWGQTNLAANEVLSALIQFPEWVLAWSDETPHIPGYRVIPPLGWDYTCVPHLFLDDHNHRLTLWYTFNDIGHRARSAPSVRRCEK